jgi:AcrR family transcriptional regulator
MSVEINFKLNEALFLRNPQDTDLGRRILKNSILLIDEIGFESFTFKKLAKVIQSTEASIYRYFENKHLLLVYLLSWYFEWLSYSIDRNIQNLTDPSRKLKIAISTIVNASIENPAVEYINESVLHRIIISEGAKAYHTKLVDQDNQKGLFLDYKKLNGKVSGLIKDVDADFKYPQALASNIMEMVNNQVFFALHLPRLTDIKVDSEVKQVDDVLYQKVDDLLQYFVFKLLKTK